MKIKEVGSCMAILSGISTLRDGSVKITLEVNPEDQTILGKLMNLYLENERLFEVGFVGVENE